MARRKKSGKPEKIVLRALEWGWVPKNPIERDSDGEVTRWRSGAVKAGEEFVWNGKPIPSIHEGKAKMNPIST